MIRSGVRGILQWSNERYEQHNEYYIDMRNTVRAVGRTIRHSLWEDGVLVLWHWRLVLGGVLFVGGLLSIQSGRYCDGATSDHFSCTRPATYYYYPEWLIAVILLGALLLALWWLRDRER